MSEKPRTAELLSPEMSGEHAADDPALDYIEQFGLNSAEQMEDLVQNGSYDDFKVHLVRLNALFRNISPEEHTIDGDTVHLRDTLVPITPERKERVVEMAFDALKDLQPKDRGVLMYNILGAVHLFNDGNGRSMRVWHHLLSGEQINHESMTLLTEHNNSSQSGIATTGRKEIQAYLNANTYETSGIANLVAFQTQLKELEVQNIRAYFPWIAPVLSEQALKDLSVSDVERVREICANDTGAFICPFNIMTMHMLSKEDASFAVPPAKVEDHMYMYDNEQQPEVSFTANQARRFIELNNDLKMQSLKAMIDIFRHPDNYKYANGELAKQSFYTRDT